MYLYFPDTPRTYSVSRITPVTNHFHSSYTANRLPGKMSKSLEASKYEDNNWSIVENLKYVVCSKSIWIGIVVIVQWVGCVCSQSWHVCTCLSNSWHKLQVAAFAQLAVVGRGSNTCLYVIAIFTMCESIEQRICIKFCFKIRKTATETYQLLQQAYGEDAMGRTQVFDWFRHLKRVESKQMSCYWLFLILSVSYTTSTLPTGKQLTRNSTWSSCHVCVNHFAENDPKNGGMATGFCTKTMRPHKLHILCSSFWPNKAPLSCRSRHTHQISHRVTFSCSQGLRKFWKDTDLRQRSTSNEIRRRNY